MFAVPGWSVSSANLKTQTTQPVHDVASTKPPSREPVPSEQAANNGEHGGKGGRSKQLKVNAANLADLWETVIEGRPKKKPSSKPDSGERKKRKKEHRAEKQDNERPGEGAPQTTQGQEESEPATKKRKTKDEKKQKKKDKKRDDESTSAFTTTTTSKTAPPAPPKPAATQLTPLQAAMRQKLVSARFRHLNQALYTTPSAQSLQLFSESPEMFAEYHEGFRRQVEVWPENPVDGYVAAIRARGAVKRGSHPNSNTNASATQPLPRTDGTCRIADLGCGDAALASSLQREAAKLHVKIHSFDLSSSAETNKLITRADIAALPLPDDSVDVAIFCLALMGTNWIDFIEEAFRVLRWKGELWVAEIKSRFGRVAGGGGADGSSGPGKQKRVEHSVGKRVRKEDAKAARRQEEEDDTQDLAVAVDGQDSKSSAETDVSAFVEVLRKRGFVLQGEADLGNKMFVRMRFVKGVTPMKGKGVPVPKGMQGATGETTWVRKAPKNKGKFLDGDDEPVSSEAGFLKPCVYKLR